MQSHNLKASRSHAQKQLVHFAFSAIIPLAVVAFWIWCFGTPTLVDWALLMFFWFCVGCLGISVGFHRYFTHRSFQASPWLQWFMVILGSMAMQGPVVYWVALHRSHHQHSDTPSDPHSPHTSHEKASLLRKLAAFLNGHIGWVARHEIPSPKYFAADVRQNDIAQRANRFYLVLVAVGLLAPGIVSFLFEPTFTRFCSGVVYGGFMRVIAVNHTTWAVNSVCHRFGSRAFQTSDRSCNNLLVTICLLYTSDAADE